MDENVPDHFKRIRQVSLISGIALISAAPTVSFWNPVSAGFLLLVGLIACVDWRQIKKVALSIESVTFERFERGIQDARDILNEIRKVEERISFVLTEQMINRGSQDRSGAGFGEEAEFAIYRALQEMNKATISPLLKTNMDELRKDMGFQLCNGIFGKSWLAKSAANDWARATEFKVLPDLNKIEQLASLDNTDLSRVKCLLDSYIVFLENDIVPSDELIKSLRSNKNYSKED